MNRLALYANAARSVRRRQLVGRALRPLRRRRFPAATAGAAQPVTGAEQLWRSPAFEPVRLDPRGAGTRLYAFHQHYGEEALEAARDGDPAAVHGHLARWIVANPPRRGDVWHPYALSTRVGNWIAALTLEPEAVDDAVVASIARQLAYLAGNIEDDVLGNHVVRNARALVLGGRFLDDERLLGAGLALLRREVSEQVLPDGGHYERSPVYHLIVLRDLLEVQAAAELEELDDPIGRMGYFGAALLRPDGGPALFNDGTLDLAPRLELPVSADGLAVFADTGYLVLRQPRLWLALDCGPVSPSFLPAHAHADALSVQLWIDGRPVVVDPGTPTYEAGLERDRCRSSDVHSTVTIAGVEQFAPWGAFRAGPLPDVRLLDVDPPEAEARYGGYRHVRRILLAERELRIEDVVHGPDSSSARVRAAMQLAPGADVGLLDAPGAHVTREEGTISERLYERVQAPRLVAERSGPLPLATEWRIALA